MRKSMIVRHSLLATAVFGAVLATFAFPRIPEPLAYHLFADHRSFFAVPNCLNVLSNVPFVVVGWLGLAATFFHKAHQKGPFVDPWERWPYATLFAGVALTAFGSGYYHLAPTNARLVWDRLPMSIGFMGLLTALLGERVSLSMSRLVFGPLLAAGAASVAYWYWSELRNAGDLRFYLLVQFGSLLVIVLLLVLYPARYPGTGYLVVCLAAYAASKGFELADHELFALGQVVSGHTMKHLAAAGGVACLVGMLKMRIRLAALSVSPGDLNAPGDAAV
jgi:hypothetical protein